MEEEKKEEKKESKLKEAKKETKEQELKEEKIEAKPEVKTEPKPEPVGKYANLIKEIEKLSVLELAELVKELEKRFGVSAAAPVAIAATGSPSGEAGTGEDEEKTEFNVLLKSAGDQKINVIKAVREITALGLKGAKDLVDAAPKEIKANLKKEEAEETKKKLEAVGAQVEIK